jgi:hypothetical protein
MHDVGLKVEGALPKFATVCKNDNEDDVQFLARPKLEAEGIVGSYTKVEHDACLAHVCNRGLLNCVFELAGVAYGSHDMPGTNEFSEALRKRKLDATRKNQSKHTKAAGKKENGCREGCSVKGKG